MNVEGKQEITRERELGKRVVDIQRQQEIK
jgi:hypothetical protein